MIDRRRTNKRERTTDVSSPQSQRRVAPAAQTTLSLVLTVLTLMSAMQLVTCFSLMYVPSMPRSRSFQSTSALFSSSTTDAAGTTADAATTQQPKAKTAAAPPPPAFDADASKIGDWEELHGNYLLRPSLDRGPPRALIHFLGGAFVGASPHVSYRYLLERLAAEGYLVVATPYDLAFDHLATCDAVIARFERIAAFLARTYGAVPVIGVGHSCGALLQTLITSLFPDTPRAANALLSFNNKPVSEAVPFFEEVFVPFFTYAAARNETGRVSGSDAISVGLQLAEATAQGELPSDELLSKATQILLTPVAGITGAGASDASSSSTAGVDVTVPQPVRDAVATVLKPSTAALTQAGLTPLALQALRALEQVPRLIDEVADGARDFNPPPDRTKAATRRAYRARRTLIIKYNDDPLDESDELHELLTVAGQVAAMKRPDVPIDVQRRDLPGGHVAPLLAPPLDLAKRAQDLLGETEAPTQLLYSQADATAKELVQWLEESNL